MTRDHILMGVIAICLIILGVGLFSWSRGDAHVREALEKGVRANVACAGEECNWISADYRAHVDDVDWPKQCPTCKQETLYRSELCYYGCQKMTHMKPAADGGVYCQHCKAMMVDPDAPKLDP